MTKNDPTKLGHNVLDAFQCPRSKDCSNDKCFFRKRDVLGMNVWAAAYWAMDEAEQKIQNELWDDVLWPEIKIKPGTNCYNIYCEDEMLP